MQALFPAFRLNQRTMFYLGLAVVLAFLLLAPQHAFASEGTGGSLPYEGWLTNLRNSVTGPVAFALSIIGISSIHLLKTFIEAIALVVLVVFLFLQSVRATIIPVIAVPVSLIGTFAGMYLLGFSINLLTLFGLVLAIGIVVDDAIVVVENVERIMSEEKLPPRQAAIKGMQEVQGAVIATTLVLVAVFVPVAFLGGIAGQLYKQFAVTVAVSVTSPLCAKTIDVGRSPATPQTSNHPPLKLDNEIGQDPIGQDGRPSGMAKAVTPASLFHTAVAGYALTVPSCARESRAPPRLACNTA